MPWMTIPIALGISAAASGAAQVYGTRTAGKQNRRAIEASERSDTRAAEIEAARAAEEKRRADLEMANAAEERRIRKENYDIAVQRDKERWQDYLRINEPMWRQGSGVLGSLYDIAGFGGEGGAPAYAPPTQPGPMPAGGGGGPVTLPPSPTRPPGLDGRSPMAGGPGGIDPAGRWQNARATAPQMPMPSSGQSSLTDLMQLTKMVLPSRMPTPTYTGDANLADLAMRG